MDQRPLYLDTSQPMQARVKDLFLALPLRRKWA